MKTLRLLALFTLLLAFTVPIRAVEDKGREAAVLKFEQDWADAMIKADLTALGRLQADDFVGIDPSGGVVNKSEDLAQYAPGKLKFTAMKLLDAKVRFYGDIAVVTGTTDTRGTYDGRDLSGQYRFTDVLRFNNGMWQVVSTQANRVAAP